MKPGEMPAQQSYQVKGCNVVGIAETTALPGDVHIEAFAWAFACIVHFSRARIEAIAPAKHLTSGRSKRA